MSSKHREMTIRKLKSYTADDARLSGLTDPYANAPSDINDKALRLWEQEFYSKLAQDAQYWEERESNHLAVNPTPPAHNHRKDTRPLFTWLHGMLYRWPIGTIIERALTQGEDNDKSE